MKTIIIRSSDGGKNKIIWGIILTGLFGFSAIGCAVSEDKDNLIMPLFVCAGIAVFGIYLLIQGIRTARQSKSFHPSESGIHHEFDVDAPDFVKERLNELMFEGNPNVQTTVSKTVKRVTYTGPDGVTRTTETVTQTGGDVHTPKSFHAGAVTCKACGGINKLRRGQSGVCEYCGSHIQG